MNKILDNFDTLQYRFVSPDDLDIFGQYQIELMHTEKAGLKVDFNRLSSGERVLMALVASIYKASHDGIFPDVLLLDEIDASLHPSMMQNMLNVIQTVFLPQGVKVILVTHSATTIALAPEDSICVVNPSGLNRIEPKSQKDALAILTQGFATIEQGLKIFDQVAQSDMTVISEGENIKCLAKYLDLAGIEGVELLRGAEGKSSKNQLKVLFEFFSAAQPQKPDLFILDCDVTFNLDDLGNVFCLKLPRNTENAIATSGIENLLSEELFEGFIKTLNYSRGETKRMFDDGRKRDLEDFILGRDNLTDFKKFHPISVKLKSILAAGK